MSDNNKIDGLKDFNALARAVEDAVDYVSTQDGEQKTSDMTIFVPEDKGPNRMHKTRQSAQFAADNPDVDMIIQNILYEFDHKLKG